MKIKIFFQRELSNENTLNINFREYLKKVYYFDQIVEDIDLMDSIQFGMSVKASQDSDINIWFGSSPEIKFLKGINIVWARFDSDKLPDSLISYYKNYAQCILVPSQMAKEALIKRGITEGVVDIIPEVIDVFQFHPFLRYSINKSSEPLRFLSIVDLSKGQGWEDLLEGYKLAFKEIQDVELIIHLPAKDSLDFSEKKQVFLKKFESYQFNNAKLIWGQLTSVQLFELFNFADVYVDTNAIDSWNHFTIAAAATGLPLILNCYGGPTEFLSKIKDSILEIDSLKKTINDTDYLKNALSDNSNFDYLLHSKVESIEKQFITAKLKNENLTNNAFTNSTQIRECYNWFSLVNKFLISMKIRGFLNLD